MRTKHTSSLDPSGALVLDLAPAIPLKFRLSVVADEILSEVAAGSGPWRTHRGELGGQILGFGRAHRFAPVADARRRFWQAILSPSVLRVAAEAEAWNIGALRLAFAGGGDLALQAPSLFFVTAARVSREGSASAVRPVLQRKRREVLAWATSQEAAVAESRVSMLAKVGVERVIQRTGFKSLVVLAGDEEMISSLRVLTHVPLALLDIVVEHRRHLSANWFMREVARLAERMLPSAAQTRHEQLRAELDAERRMRGLVAQHAAAARTLRDMGVPTSILREARDGEQLERIAARAVARELDSRPFPPPPLPGRVGGGPGQPQVVPLDSAHAMREHGLRAKNCTASLVKAVVEDGNLYVYAVTGPDGEVATAAVEIKGAGFRVGADMQIEFVDQHLKLGPVLANGNRKVSVATAHMVRGWFDEEMTKKRDQAQDASEDTSGGRKV